MRLINASMGFRGRIQALMLFHVLEVSLKLPGSPGLLHFEDCDCISAVSVLHFQSAVSTM